MYRTVNLDEPTRANYRLGLQNKPPRYLDLPALWERSIWPGNIPSYGLGFNAQHHNNLNDGELPNQAAEILYYQMRAVTL